MTKTIVMKGDSNLPKVAFAFSKLSEINLKRSDHYTAAAEQVGNAYRKTILMNYAYHAQQLSAELKRWLNSYKVVVPKSDNALKFSWERMKNLFFKQSENHIYEDCEMLEEEAMRGYNTAITLAFIPPKAMGEVKRHIQHIEKIRASLKEMKNSPRKAQVA